MNENIMKSLISPFIAELEDFTVTLESDIIELETTSDADLINKVFRAFHSIKGSSGIIGFKRLSQFTHKAEFLLEEARSGRFQISSKFIDTLLECNNIFKVFLNNIINTEVNSEEDAIKKDLLVLIERAENELTKFSKDFSKEKDINLKIKKEEKKYEYNFFEISINLKPNIFESGNDPLMYLEDLFEHGEYVKIKCYTKEIQFLENYDPYKNYLSWKILYKTEKDENFIKNIFLFIIGDNDIVINDVTDFVYYKTKGNISLLEKILHNNDDEIFPSLIKDYQNFLKEKGLKSETSSDSEKDHSNKDDLSDESIDKNEISEEDTKSFKKTIKSQFIRVDIRKIDELVKLVGEMVIGYSQMIQAMSELIPQSWEQTEVYATVENFHRTINDIQSKVMKIRMIPIGPTFAQFKLLIRDYSAKLNKKVGLEFHGEDTELDKRIIEVVSDPLRHMVRNSVYHGIESIEERIYAGKSEVGLIKLNAYHEEGNMVIEVIDDGKGLNKKKILKKAIELGLYDSSKGKILDEREVYNFIFEPGFSTADEISDLSGRGVGMDVVKSNIESMRGKIYVSSVEGESTTFKIILPLTVSIIEGMIFGVGDKLFILPLLSIISLIRPSNKMITKVEGKSEIINLRGEFIPLLRLYKEFDIEAKITDSMEAIILIVESEGRRYGIMVDELISQQQVVIKPIDKMFEKVKGITGASILGSGKVALIIDAPTLIRMSSYKPALT